MQLFVLSVLFLLAFIRSSGAESESDLLSSLDIIVFRYSQRAYQHWDCSRVGDRAAKAEEARIWQAVIPDARIEEIVAASGNKALQKAEQYKWVSSDLLMQSSVILGMRKPDLDGSTAPAKVLHSKSKQVNQDALSAVLSQLEQSKDRIMEWMARTQVLITSMTPRITDPLADQRFGVPQATNYHPRVFRHPHFTTGDLVAWIALTAELRQKGHADAFKFFKLMVKSLLPGFSVSLEAVPASSAGEPTETVYLHRPFQYVPAGADLAFYFDGNRGKFLKTREDSIVLNRPEGIVDGQQHTALLLSSSLNVDASSLEIHPSKTDIAMRMTFCGQLEKALALDTSSGATGAEAVGVSTIRSRAAHLQRDSFLEAQRKAPESKPTLLSELLPAKLVKLVIEYFSDDAYPFIVSTHKWSFKDEPEIAVDGARLYVITNSEGLKGLDHSFANLEENKRRCTEFGDSQWYSYMEFVSSHDGRFVSFNYKYRVATDRKKQAKHHGAKWLMQSNEPGSGKFKHIASNEKGNFSCGFLSHDGRTLFSYNEKTDVTRVHQIKEEAGKNFTAIMKFDFSGYIRTISGDGNRVVIKRREKLEVHDVGVDASKLVCQIDANARTCVSALNKDGSEAAYVKGDELQIMEVGKVGVDKGDQHVIVSIKIPNALGAVLELVYSDENKLHVLHKGGKISLFDPLKRGLISIEAPQKGQEIVELVISSDAGYIATLQCVGKEEKSGQSFYRTIVKRKLGSPEWRGVFGYEVDKIGQP